LIVGRLQNVAQNTRGDFIKRAATGTAAFLAANPTALGRRGRSSPMTAWTSTLAVSKEAAKIALGLQTFDGHRRVLDMKDIDGIMDERCRTRLS